MRVTVKVDAVLQLCVAAATLQFNRYSRQIVEAFDASVLSTMLSSDSLGIDSEEELLSILAGAKVDRKAEELLVHVRLASIPFARLLTVAQTSPRLQQSAAFKDLLKKLLKWKFGKASRPAASPAAAAAATAVQAARSMRCLQSQVALPSDAVSVDALVEWLAAPMPIQAELSETKRRLDEALARIASLEAPDVAGLPVSSKLSKDGGGGGSGCRSSATAAAPAATVGGGGGSRAGGDDDNDAVAAAAASAAVEIAVARCGGDTAAAAVTAARGGGNGGGGGDDIDATASATASVSGGGDGGSGRDNDVSAATVMDCGGGSSNDNHAAAAAAATGVDGSGGGSGCGGSSEETKQCSACGASLPLAAFSSRQWKMAKLPRRCTACLDNR